MTELLPCPFCGDDNLGHAPDCYMALCRLPDLPPPSVMEAAWNRRAPVQASEARGLQDAYDVGWIECTNWAKRDDLVADMDSPAYAKDRARNLAALSAHTQAGPVG